MGFAAAEQVEINDRSGDRVRRHGALRGHDYSYRLRLLRTKSSAQRTTLFSEEMDSAILAVGLQPQAQ